MVEIVFLVSLITGVIAFFVPRTLGRPLLVFTGVVHLILSLYLWLRRPAALFEGYFSVTPEGLLSLLVISLLFFFDLDLYLGLARKNRYPLRTGV